MDTHPYTGLVIVQLALLLLLVSASNPTDALRTVGFGTGILTALVGAAVILRSVFGE